MNNEERTRHIRNQIEEIETRHRENNRHFDFLEEFINRSTARNREAFDNIYLSPSEFASLSELESDSHRFANFIQDKREQMQFDYQIQIEQYKEELEMNYDKKDEQGEVINEFK